MEITFISDSHGKHDLLTEGLKPGKTIIHSGDISSRGYEWEIRAFLEWFSSLPYQYKIFTAGNHDWLFQRYSSIAKELLSEFPDIIYLEDSGITIEGINIWGSPQTPRFFDWAFNVDRDEIYKFWELIPEDTDILITHGPPYKIGDLVNNRYHTDKNVGCKALAKRVLEVKPKIHVFGHIHCGYGIYTNEHTTFINAAVLDEDYTYTQKPTIFKLGL